MPPSAILGLIAWQPEIGPSPARLRPCQCLDRVFFRDACQKIGQSHDHPKQYKKQAIKRNTGPAIRAVIKTIKAQSSKTRERSRKEAPPGRTGHSLPCISWEGPSASTGMGPADGGCQIPDTDLTHTGSLELHGAPSAALDFTSHPPRASSTNSSLGEGGGQGMGSFSGAGHLGEAGMTRAQGVLHLTAVRLVTV